ncbi:MAG: chemotaxis protein CheA, partial [Bacteroidales bacterium]|nr:chemotaxis protein CheA [Bacteroidales bacterium]
QEIISVTLSSVDHLKDLLEGGDDLNEKTSSNHQVLLNRISRIIDNVPGEATSETKKESGKTEEQPVKKVDTFNDPTYLIVFKPHHDLFKNGTNPLLLIDELHTLGHCKPYVRFDEIPLPQDFVPDHCYTYWQVLLSTSKTENDIKDVFIFVEDECELTIEKVSDINILVRSVITDEIAKIVSLGQNINLEMLQAMVQMLHKAEDEVDKSGTTSTNGALIKDAGISSIRVNSEKLDHLMSLVSELITTQAGLSLFSERANEPELQTIAENIEKISRQLRDNTFDICLIPIETVMVRFRRLVRDLSAGLGKEIQFVAEGTETELDKSIIEGLTEPLMHIFRNAIDHGIESIEDRLKKGKPRQGKIVLKAFYSGANVFLQVKDDGAGIDVDKIRQKAISRGFISPDARLSYKELLNLVFLPGFSTAAKVTEVSGRGVGLDVVVKKISEIRGEVEIESQLGIGTTISIKLPLTLSIIDGLLVKIDKTHFVIPLSGVDKCYEAAHESLVNTFNNIVVLDGKQVPFVNLRNEFDITENVPKLEQVIVVNYEDRKVGMTVDFVVGEYQAVLKPLGKLFKNQEVVSGATILGDGTIALVLDPSKIIMLFDRQAQIDREALLNKYK